MRAQLGKQEGVSSDPSDGFEHAQSPRNEIGRGRWGHERRQRHASRRMGVGFE